MHALLTRRPDVVVHLAAIAGVRPSLEAPQRYVDTNVSGTVSVLEACVRARVPRLVMASSSSVYGDASGRSHEDDRLAPLSPYAATKAATEALAQSYARGAS